MFNIFGPAKKRVKYSSAPTRHFSLDVFMGGAEINETHEGPLVLPGDGNEDLVARFGSRTYCYDLPSRHGVQVVDRRLGSSTFHVNDEIQTWMRDKGQVIK